MPEMKLLATLILSIVLVAGASAQSEKLPRNAAELIRKLQAYEKQEREQVNQRIEQKRSQVAAALEIELKKATASQDLDGAIAIRKVMQSLKGDPLDQSNPAPDLSGDSLPKSEREFSKWIVGKEYKVTLQDRTYKFGDDGHVIFTYGGKKDIKKYKVTSGKGIRNL